MSESQNGIWRFPRIVPVINEQYKLDPKKSSNVCTPIRRNIFQKQNSDWAINNSDIDKGH